MTVIRETPLDTVFEGGLKGWSAKFFIHPFPALQLHKALKGCGVLQGDVIQPTAVHASFAYAPLFRAIDEKFQRQRLQQLAASVRLLMSTGQNLSLLHGGPANEYYETIDGLQLTLNVLTSSGVLGNLS